MIKTKKDLDPYDIYGTEFHMFIQDVSFPHVLNHRDAFIINGEHSEGFIKMYEHKRNYSSDIFEIIQHAIMDLITHGITYIDVKIASEGSQIKKISIYNCKRKRKKKDNRNVVKIEYPKSLQTKISHRKMLNRFKNIPNLVEVSKLNQEKIPYNFEKFNEIRYKKLATLTGDLYWNARGLYREKMTIAYDLFCEINSRIAQIEFIDTILSKINEELGRIGCIFRFNNWFEPKYILNKHELVQLLENVQEGTIQLKDIHNKLFSQLYL